MPDCLKPVQHNKSFSEWKHFFRQVNVCSQSGKLHAHLKLNQLKNVAEFSSANVLKWKLDSFPLVNFCSGPWEPKCERECVCVRGCKWERENGILPQGIFQSLPLPLSLYLSLSLLSNLVLSKMLNIPLEHPRSAIPGTTAWEKCDFVALALKL